MKRLLGGTAVVLSTLALAGADGKDAGAKSGDGTEKARPVTPAGETARAPAAATNAPTDAGRSAYLAGKRASGEARRRHFQAGITAARARLADNPDDPDGLLWLAANLGSEALERGKLSALPAVKEMERLLLRLEAVAPAHDHAAAARTLARLYHKAPSLISIGSMKKARDYWQRALERAGEHPANLVLAADFYADDGQRPRALELARRYLRAPVAAADHPDAPEWLDIANRIVRAGADDEGAP